MTLNYFKLFEALPHRKQPHVGSDPSVVSTFHCPVYLLFNSYTVEHEPSLQVFGIGIPLLCWFNCPLDFFFLIPLSSSCYGL